MMSSFLVVLYPGAVVKFSNGLIGVLSLCNFGNPVKGAFALIGFKYLLVRSSNRCMHLFIH